LESLTVETFTRNPSRVNPNKFIKYVDVSAISNEYFKIIDNQFVKGSEAPGRARKVIQTNDVIFATIRPTLKRIAKINSDYNDEYCSTAFCVLRPNQELLNEDYLYYYLLTDIFIEEIAKHQSGASYPAVRDDNVKNMMIPFPIISEQKKIAYVLSKIQRAIETQYQITKTTQELKKALMHKLFTEGLNGEPQKQTEIGLIPESWEVADLEKTGDVVYGIQASVAHLKEPIGLPILTNKNITLDGEIDLSKLNHFELKTKRHFATILKKGDILFNWRSGSKEHVGKTAYFNLEGEYVHSSFILRIRPKSDVNNKYLFYYLTYLRLSEYFIKLHSYSINAKFNKSAVNKLPTVLPSLDIQELVADYLADIDMKITTEENKLLYLKDLFSSSLNNLMTGQIRVKDIEFKLEELEYH